MAKIVTPIDYIQLTWKITTGVDLDGNPVEGQTDSDYLRLDVTASDQAGDPANIFVHRVQVINKRAEESEDVYTALFDRVCSPNDFQELYSGVPTLEQDIILFRTNEITYIFSNLQEIVSFKKDIEKDVQALITAHKKLLKRADSRKDESWTAIS